MKPSAVRLRSDRNWMRSWFPSENTGLQGHTGKQQTEGEVRRSHRMEAVVEMNHLLWGGVSTVFPNPLGIVDFGPIENGDVVVAAVVVSFHVKLLKLHLDDLQQETGSFHQAGNSPRPHPSVLIKGHPVICGQPLFVHTQSTLTFAPR